LLELPPHSGKPRSRRDLDHRCDPPQALVRFSRPFRIDFRAGWTEGGKALIVNRAQTVSHIVMFDHFWVGDRTK
jgi:hypothetical protein